MHTRTSLTVLAFRGLSVVNASLLIACVGCSLGSDCQELQDRAENLTAEFSACGAGDACAVVALSDLVPDACLQPFQCLIAFREGSDRQDFARRARTLEEEFSMCGECATASCDDPRGWTAVCATEEARCRLVRSSDP